MLTQINKEFSTKMKNLLTSLFPRNISRFNAIALAKIIWQQSSDKERILNISLSLTNLYTVAKCVFIEQVASDVKFGCRR